MQEKGIKTAGGGGMGDPQQEKQSRHSREASGSMRNKSEPDGGGAGL